MKKKLLTVTVGVCLMVALVGCGAKETATVGSESKANKSEVGAVVSDIAFDAVDAAIDAVESTTEYGTEETTEVVEETTETVVEEQATETTEAVEETVAEETASAHEGYPTVFANDDPRTSEVVDLQALLGDADMRMYVWAGDEAPIITMYPTTENYETVKEAVTLDIEGIESFATVSTDEGEKEVVLVTTANDDGTVSYEYVYTLGSCTIKVDDTVSHCVEAAEDLQYFVDLIRFE